MTIRRAPGATTFPAGVAVVEALRSCPCGQGGDLTRACTCPESAVSRYRKRLSEPLLDRIDLHVEVPRVDAEQIGTPHLAEAGW